MEKYKYTGPDVTVHPINRKFCVILTSGETDYITYATNVKAEVNINIATIKSVYNEHYECWQDIEPIYVAAKYLEPVKPEPIHFDPKDDESSKGSSDADEFWKKFFMDSDTFPFFAEKMPFDTDTYYTPKKVREYLEKVQGQSVPRKEAEKIVNGSNDGHEIGGTHYKMAIEPWDYIHANGLGFDEGNIVKYASRHKQKNGAEDIKKIISYAKHILKTQYGEELDKR